MTTETHEPTIETQELAAGTWESVIETLGIETQGKPLHKKNDDKAKIQESLEIIDLDAEDEKVQEEEKYIYLWKDELNKWRYQDTPCEEGMAPLPLHRNTIKELREKWAKVLTFQRLRWEKLQGELKELRNLTAMKKKTKKMYNLIQELLICRAPYPS